MKKLMMLALVALLSFGVASVSWAQEPTPGAHAGKAEKKHHKAKKKKKAKKAKEAAPEAAPQ